VSGALCIIWGAGWGVGGYIPRSLSPLPFHRRRRRRMAGAVVAWWLRYGASVPQVCGGWCMGCTSLCFMTGGWGGLGDAC